MAEIQKNQYFTQQLLKWNHFSNKREMPWKGEKDPYKIWLSEIILQQTRVEQGLDYYQRFVTAFPHIHQLAAAPEQQVFKLWEGLGYYTRCKNLIVTAKYISKDLKGKFPDSYEEILGLKGIGPYTAAAISSFAFNLPHAVVDGNVLRVLSRYFGISIPIDSNEGKKYFTELAENLLNHNKPGEYNQALMDFGATVCKPQNPLCNKCPMQKKCIGYLNDAVNKFPVKEKSITKRTRWFYYVVAEYKGEIFIRKRDKKDIWENLYEFILSEYNKSASADEVLKKLFPAKQFSRPGYLLVHVSGIYKQQLTHQTIYGQFIKVQLRSNITPAGYEKVKKENLYQLPFPKFITTYLKDKNVSLNLF